MFKRQPPDPKPLPFSEEEIQVRAFEISQLRSEKEASPEDDWFAAIEDLKAEHSLSEKIRWIWRMFKFPDQQKLALELSKLQVERVKTRIAAAGLAASIFAGVGLVLNYCQGSERLVTERYGKAVEQLGAKDSSVRIGGIYALERITKDSSRDHWTIMEVLTAFIRENSPRQSEAFTKNPGKAQAKDLQNKATQTESNPVATDVQAALTVIGRRSTKNKSELGQIDLKGTNLSNAYLVGADLADANLRKADLAGADLTDANLRKADLAGADLTDANLRKADLAGADLTNANLRKADLAGADLADAFLNTANLSSVNLGSANLSNADLSNSDLRRAYLDSANLSNAYLAGADLGSAKFNTANLSNAYLAGADLGNAKFNTANLSNANLNGVNLSNAYLGSANLNGADLGIANLSNANLSNANLVGAYLVDANLNGAIVTEGQLKQAILCRTTLMDGKTRSDRDCEKERGVG